jgi:type II secretory pathway predicted ATPase ExeA
MQPDQVEAFGLETRRSPIDADRFAVSSRRRALDRLRGAFRGGPIGPVLITGEPGAGKTWLVRRLVEGLPAGWRPASVELSTALDGLELLRLVGDGLGLAMPDRLGAARLALGAGLRDAHADGRKWWLIVDEAQRAGAEVREEIQVLSNLLGGAGGFDGLILLGRTELARELASRGPRAWSSRLAMHIHLPPLDLDEARELLKRDGRLTEPELEEIHRDALGNPRAIRRLAEARAWESRPSGAEASTACRPAGTFRLPRPGPRGEVRVKARPDRAAAPDGPGIPSPAEESASTPPRPASLLPARPPIRIEDGLVEVGWEGDLEAEPTRPETPTIESETVGASFETDPSEQLVEDRYAALQAWAEWSRNREGSPPPPLEPSADFDEGTTGPGTDPGSYAAAGPREDAGPESAPSVRAETSHDFAPYSQLFTRLRHSL